MIIELARDRPSCLAVAQVGAEKEKPHSSSIILQEGLSQARNCSSSCPGTDLAISTWQFFQQQLLKLKSSLSVCPSRSPSSVKLMKQLEIRLSYLLKR